MSRAATARKLNTGNRTPETGPIEAGASMVHGTMRRSIGNPKLKTVSPRTLDSFLREGKGQDPFREWSLMVEQQVDQAMGKPGVPKDRKQAREHVLAQDRSHWM
jgi:hypothetical protein